MRSFKMGRQEMKMQHNADDLKTVLEALDQATAALGKYIDPCGTSGPIATVDRLLMALRNPKLDEARKRLGRSFSSFRGRDE